MISNYFAGVLHENHKRIIARGPWVFDALVPARYEAAPGGGERPCCAGSCDVCGQSICDVVYIRQPQTGERLMLGLDCASTFERNLGKSYRDAVSGLRKVKREATTRRKAEKLADVLGPLRAEMTAWASEETFRANVARNALRVMDKGRRPSAAHMALIEKLRAEEPRPARVVRPAREEERHVPAPTGKMTVRGTVVSTKSVDMLFNGAPRVVYKMTVKVATDDGVYLVCGTCPQALLGEAEKHLDCPDGWLPGLRGTVVEFTAELIRSDRDAHFAFASRPSKARLVSWPEDRARKPAPWEAEAAA